MQLTVVGPGDVFGRGGRFNTCIDVRAESTRFLIDCGASSMVALKRAETERDPIDTIFVAYCHGDHVGGIPYFVLDAQFLAKRTGPLTSVGPDGIETWCERVMETVFPGSTTAKRAFGMVRPALPASPIG